MSQSSFDLSGSTGPLAIDYIAPLVLLYNPDGGDPFTWLPNVVCTFVGEVAGPAPPTARFRYIMDDALDLNLGWPSRVDEIWPLGSSGPYVVQPDDRLVVMATNPDGSSLFLFDGFAQIPQADLSENSEQATFTAVGVAIREFDNPISGRTQRDSHPDGIQDTSGDSDVAIDLPCRFNPSDETYDDDGGFQPNKTPDNYDTAAQTDEDDGSTTPAHPVFVQVGIQGRDEDESPAYWSISDALKYILAEYNPTSQWTSYPALSTLDDLLETAYPEDETGAITDGDVKTDPLLLRDFDASNAPWPDAVATLLGYAGFLMRWDLDTGTDGMPTTYLRIYRADMLSETPLKQLYLDVPGSSLAQGSRNNACQIHLARDSNAIVNAWQVETSQRLIEVSIYLAPLYQPAAGDETASASKTSGRNQFTNTNLTANNATATDRRKYRWYGADEIGDGFWSAVGSKWTTGTPLDLTPVFPDDEDKKPTYAVRYRKAAGRLVTEDSQNRPLRARLDIAFGVDNSGPIVAPADDQTQWYPVPHGWRLLPDRLGIEVTCEDPEQWSTGDKGLPGGGDIRGIAWWANPPSSIGGVDTGGSPPTLRLTCVIEDDLRMPISVGKRVGSPTQFARWRVADGRDHFQYTSIDKSSANYASQGGDGTDPFVVRDDTDAAMGHARALQRAHEMPPLAGSIQMPGTIGFYEIGDRVSYISGRGIQLYQSAGQAQGELVTYPVVVAREFTLEDGDIYTTIHLSDMRAAPRMHAAVHRDHGNSY